MTLTPLPFSSLTAILHLTILISTTRFASALTPQWLVPDSSQPNLATTWNDGDSVTLSWATLNSSICDLWLTDPNSSNDYAIRLASNIDLDEAGTLPWSINIGNEQLHISDVFVLCFIPTGQAYTPSGGLSTGVKVGAAIAIVVVLSLIIGLLFWVFRLRQRVKRAQTVDDDRKGILRSVSSDTDLELTPSPSPRPTTPPPALLQQQLRNTKRRTLPGLHEMKADTRQPQEMSGGGGGSARWQQLRGEKTTRGAVYEMPA
ncbi:hypothetical protein DV736_g3139, partial [Chaetothyriales sp. CBS 134916]